MKKDFKRNLYINQELIPLKSPTFHLLRGNSDDTYISCLVYMVVVDNWLIYLQCLNMANKSVYETENKNILSPLG